MKGIVPLLYNMMKSFRILFSVSLVALAATFASAATVAPSPAPEWTLNDVDGNPVSFAQFKGKTVVIDFWATWCPPCRVEIPGYIEMQNEYAKDDLVIIGVSLDRKGPEVVKSFMEKHGMNYVVVMGNEKTVEAFGGFRGIPTTFIVDRDGNIRDKKTGAEEKEVFEARLKKYLN